MVLKEGGLGVDVFNVAVLTLPDVAGALGVVGTHLLLSVSLLILFVLMQTWN